MYVIVNSQKYKSLEIYAVTISRYLWLNITVNFNKPSDWGFLLRQQSIVGNVYGKSGHCVFSHFFKTLNDAFKVHIYQGLILTPYQTH